MPFYAFRLDSIDCVNQRGKIPDDDIITFQVMINGAQRGLAAAYVPSLVSGLTLALAAPLNPPPSFDSIPATTLTNAAANWIIGPFEIAATDNIAVGYSGTNTSDSQLGPDTTTQDKITLTLADLFFDAMGGLAIDGAAGALAGAGVSGVSDLLDKLSDALDSIADPVGSLIGFHPQGPCNGVAFAGAQTLTGAALAQLPFKPPSAYVSLVQGVEAAFTTTKLDDQSTHNTDNCGHVAGTVVHWSAIQIPDVALRQYFRQTLSGGLRKYATPSQDVHLRSFLHLLS